MYKIYIVRNTVNGKIYVGMTGKTVAQRWALHLANARKDSPKQSITRAIKKYGPENFTIRKIDGCESRELACGLEMTYILLYQATNTDLGYNCTFGGDGVVPTPEVREKIGRGHRGIYGVFNHTEETKARISQTMTGIPKPADFGKKVSAGKIGKKLSARGCQNMSTAHKGKPAPNRRKDVLDEEVAAMYVAGKSKAEIGRHFNISDTTVVRRLAAVGLVAGYKKKEKWWMTQTN